MPVAKSNRTISFSGYYFAEDTAEVNEEHSSVWEIPLAAVPAENTGALSTPVADRVVTLSAGHDIVSSGSLVDVYWTGGMRYGCTAVVATNEVTLTGGAGDALPGDGTDVTLATQVPIDPLAIAGANLEWLGVVYDNASDTGAKASLDMHDAAGSEYQWDLVHYTTLNGCNNVHNVSGGATNPVTGDVITDGFASHDSASAATLYILALLDPTA